MALTTSHYPGVTDLFIKDTVMIDRNGEARLADFGILTFVSRLPTHFIPNSLLSPIDATIRWMSPELFDPGGSWPGSGQPTKESDYYALGMVILEVLSGAPPFPYVNYRSIKSSIIDGARPRRPGGARFTDALWGITEQCWLLNPNDRPTAEAVLQSLEQASKL